VIFKLQKRHGVTTIDELLKLQESFEQKLTLVSDSNGAIEAMERSTAKQFLALLKKSKAIHGSREQRYSRGFGYRSTTFTASRDAIGYFFNSFTFVE
jgi:DNA repair ATPase RecN